MERYLATRIKELQTATYLRTGLKSFNMDERMLAMSDTHIALDHVGILVADFDAALGRYGALLSGTFEVFEPDETLDCHWARLEMQGTPPVELVAPRSDRSPYAEDLRRRGEGLHHVSFRVGDIVAERERIAALGLDIRGFSLDHGGWQELFVHPRQTHGALLHFCVPPQT